MKPEFLIKTFIIVIGLVGITTAFGQKNGERFHATMKKLATAWTNQDVDAALECFSPDAQYIQPPDLQFYNGSKELRLLFEGLEPGTFMRFHHLWFDEKNSIGAGEFSFGNTNDANADHGICVVEMKGDKIFRWREYFVSGPSSFAQFISVDGKKWKWDINALQKSDVNGSLTNTYSTVIGSKKAPFQDVVLTITGEDVKGKYDWYNGKIEGVLRSDTLKGIWRQDNQGYGIIKFIFDKDLSTFTGLYNDILADPDKWFLWNGKKK